MAAPDGIARPVLLQRGNTGRGGYLGPRGTFTEEAARDYARRRSGGDTLIPWADIPDMLRAVDRGELGWAVAPVENSLEGTVPITVDMLVHEITSPVCGEIVVPVRHFLLAPGPSPLDRVERVLSHPQALAQCRGWLERHLPHARREATASTAEAARLVAEMPAGAAAIGTAAAGEIYGLTVLAEDIQDADGNMTRFLAVGRDVWSRTGRDKTSIAFSFPEDAPGVLYRALGEFARRDINLSKLESRPTRKALGRYLFLADLEGHRDDPAVVEALEALRPRCALFKVLGSYPQVVCFDA